MGFELLLETIERREGIEGKREMACGVLKIARPKLLERRHLAYGVLKLSRILAARNAIDVFLVNQDIRRRRLAARLFFARRAQRILELPLRSGNRSSAVEALIVPHGGTRRKRRAQSRPQDQHDDIGRRRLDDDVLKGSGREHRFVFPQLRGNLEETRKIALETAEYERGAASFFDDVAG